jgi:hypothetical protein
VTGPPNHDGDMRHRSIAEQQRSKQANAVTGKDPLYRLLRDWNICDLTALRTNTFNQGLFF